MNKISNFLSKFLNPFASFMNRNKYAIVIRESLVVPMILIMVGSFATLGNVYICGKDGLAGIESLAWLSNYSKIFTSISFACISCLALFSSFLIGYKLGEINKLKPLQTALIAVACFFILSDTENLASAVGASSLFLAFISSITSVQLFTKMMTVDKIRIKLHSAVPPIIADVFNSLFPAAITIITFGIFGGVFFEQTGGMYLNDLIYKFIQMPLANVVDSRMGVTLITVLIMLLWWLGIHGNSAVKPVTVPIFTAGLAANIAAVEAGAVPTHIYTQPFQNNFVGIGGTGVIIGLALAILVFSRREDYREVTKTSFIPLIFGISEPMVFGLPIMLNPIFLIPFILAPVVSVNIGYTLCQTIMTPAYVYAPARTPIILQSFLNFSGQWIAPISAILVISVAFLIYAPFVIIANKEKLEGEGK